MREFEIISREKVYAHLAGVNPIPYSEEFERFCNKRYATKTLFVAMKQDTEIKCILPIFLHTAFNFSMAEMPLSAYYAEPIVVDKNFVVDLKLMSKELAKFLKVDMIKTNLVDRKNHISLKKHTPKYVSITLNIGDYESAEDLLKRSVVLRRRNQIRFSFKQGFTTKLLGPEGLDELYELYKTHHQDRNYVVRGKDELLNIFGSFGDKAHIMAAYKDDKMIAGIIFVADGQYLWMLINVSDFAFSYFQINNYIYWEVIKWGFDHGVTRVDFGGTPLTDTGNIHYKKAFGVSMHPIYAPIYASSLVSHLRYWFQRKTWHLKLRLKVIRQLFKRYGHTH